VHQVHDEEEEASMKTKSVWAPRAAAEALGEYVRDEFHPNARQVRGMRERIEALVEAVHDHAMMPRLAIASLLGGIVDAGLESGRQMSKRPGLSTRPRAQRNAR
jgi:hypothetical protein